MASIAGLSDSRKHGPPADIGTFQMATTALVFHFQHSGVGYVAAISAGAGGWVLLDQVVAGTVDDQPLQAALDYCETFGSGETLVNGGQYYLAAKLEVPSLTIFRGLASPRFTATSAYLRLVNGVDDDVIGNKAGATKVEIRNFDIFGNRANQANGHGINIDAIDSIIDGNYINDVKQNGINVAGQRSKITNNTFQNIDGNGIDIAAADCFITFNGGTASVYGLRVAAGNVDVVNNRFFSCGTDGIFLTAGADNCTVALNRVSLNTRHGIINQGDWSIIVDNRSLDNTENGIHNTARDVLIGGNHCYSNDDAGIFQSAGIRCSIVGNLCYFNGESGIHAFDMSYNNISSNECMNNGQDGAFSGIFLDYFAAVVGYNVISDNICSDDQGVATQQYGIYLDGNANVVENIITGNVCRGHTQYGIRIGAGALRNVVKDNVLTGNAVGAILEAGTDTILATLEIQLVQGTTFISTADEAWGWRLNADTNFALGIGWLPYEVQQVVRIRIIGVGLAAPGAGNYMRIQITGDGGTFAEGFATEPIDVVDKNNEEVNFAIDNPINWVFDATDDADIGHLLGGDRLQIKVLHEGAGNGNIATNAIVDTIQVEVV